VSVVPAPVGGKFWPRVLPNTDAARSAAPLASVIAALVVAATVAVGMRGGPALHAGEARLVLNGAAVDVELAGHAYAHVSGTPTLHSGDRVRVRHGEPDLRLPNNAQAALRDGSIVRVGGAGGPALVLERGDVLASGRVVVQSLEATATVHGTAKLIERAGLLAGVYDGVAIVRPADAPTQTVDRFRQLAVLGLGASSGDIDPLRVDESDRWDRRILGDVLDLDARLESFAVGFDAQLPADTGSTTGFYKQMIPELADENITPDMIEGRSAGENLIGFTLVSLDKGSFAERVAHIFGFRDQGARWGLVAADRGLKPETVLDRYQVALGRAGRSTTVALPRLNTTAPTTSHTNTGGTPTTRSSSPTTQPTQPPSTTTTIVPVPPPVNGLLGILGGLLTTTTTRPPSGVGQTSSGKSLGHLLPRIRFLRAR